VYDEYESIKSVPPTPDLDEITPDSPPKPKRGRPRIWPEGSNWRAKCPVDAPAKPAVPSDWEDEIIGWGEQDQDGWESLRRAIKRGGSRYEQGDD
jgi:hypothetical protein